jgi:hypothetical protein
VAVDGYDGAIGALVLNWSPFTSNSAAAELTRTLHSFTNGIDRMNPQAGCFVGQYPVWGQDWRQSGRAQCSP